MATWYVDYEGGLDTNDGSSFALRKKTLSFAGLSAATPGDTVRIMESTGRGNTNITSTWTANSNTITLSGSLNLLLYDGGTAWVNVANTTCNTNLSMRRLQTSNAAVSNVHTDFVTGKASYFTLPVATDCSGYTGISYWYHATLIQNTSNLSIRLCSDTTGDVPVNTIPIPAINVAGHWVPLYIDTGGTLGASIQSIALYVDSNTAAINVMFQNINTTKSNTNANNLNITSIINPGNVANSGWWGIRAINGTTIYLDSTPRIAWATEVQGYAGDTETTFLYKTDTTQTIRNLYDSFFGGTVQTLPKGGNLTHIITYSGGWDRSSMSIQSGETWYDGMGTGGKGIIGDVSTHTMMDKINFARYFTGFFSPVHTGHIGTMFLTGCIREGGFISAEASDINFLCATGCGGVQNDSAGIDIAAAPGSGGRRPHSIINTLLALSCGGGSTTTYGVIGRQWTWARIGTIITKRNSHGGVFFQLLPQSTNVDFLYAINNGGDGVGHFTSTHKGDMMFGLIHVEGNRRYGMVMDTSSWSRTRIRHLYAINNLSQGLYLGAQGEGNAIGLLTTQGNGIAGVHINNTSVFTMRILNSSISEATKVSFGTGTTNRNRPGEIVFRNMNGVVGDHRSYFHNNSAHIFASTEQRHTASGMSWKLSPRNALDYNSLFPLKSRVAAVTVLAGQGVTVGLWFYRDNNAIKGILKIRGEQIAGVPNDLTQQTNGTVGVWEELTRTFTPTESGTIEIEAHAYGGDTYNVWIDDFRVES